MAPDSEVRVAICKPLIKPRQRHASVTVSAGVMTSLEPGFTPLIPRCTESIVAHFLIIVKCPLRSYDFSTTSYTAGLSTYLCLLHRYPLTHLPPTSVPCSSTFRSTPDAFHFNSVTISSSVDTAVTNEHIVKSPET